MQSHFFLALPPWALRRAQKFKYQLISITKSISKIFIPNFVCVLTNERYKTYQTGFSLCSLGHALGVGLWGTGGSQVVKKKIQTWSYGISNRQGWQAEQNASKIFIRGPSWWPWGEAKGQISLNSGYHRALTRILKTGVQDSHLAKSRSPTGKSRSPTQKKLESHQFVHTVYLFHFSRKWYFWIIFRLTDFNPLSINGMFLLNKTKYFGIFFHVSATHIFCLALSK